MSIPGHSVIPVSESDLPTIAGFIRDSRFPLAFNRLLYDDWPNDVAQLAVYMNVINSWASDPSKETFKVVEDESGHIVAHVSIWRIKPNATKPPKANLPDGVIPDVWNGITAAAIEANKELQDVDRLVLRHIYVQPSSRRHGIGSHLVQMCLEKSKAAGIPLTLVAESESHDFFLKKGFEDVKSVDIDLRQWAPPHSGYGIFRISRMGISD